MKTLIVVESQFGNTRAVAEAIARGVAVSSIVEVVDVAAAPGILDDVDLLVIGGPTHAFSMSRPQTRAASHEEGGAGTTRGVREWIASTPAPIPVSRVAVFGTKQGHHRWSGSAATSAAAAIRRRATAVAAVEDFFVTAKQGPLEEGETERAAAWGRALVAQSSSSSRGLT
jgi:hypothetical protein